MTSERQSLGQRAAVPVLVPVLVLVVALAMLVSGSATTGCSKNEEIVCGTTTENKGPTCAAEYTLCAGGTDRIDCKSATGGVTCACIENGTTKKSFQSHDVCNVTADTLKKRAAEGCGWTLE